MEIWLTIPSLDGLYEASSLGRVRRVIYRNGSGRYSMAVPRIMTQRLDRYGYFTVTITVDNHWSPFGVHGLVCEAFHGPRPSSAHQAAHGDGSRTRNVPDNLDWKTPLEQAADKHRHGTTVRGSKCHMSRLSEVQVHDIRARYRRGNGNILAKEFGVTKEAVHAVVTRKVWKHV